MIFTRYRLKATKAMRSRCSQQKAPLRAWFHSVDRTVSPGLVDSETAEPFSFDEKYEISIRDSLVGGAITIMKHMSSSDWIIIPTIGENKIPWFQSPPTSSACGSNLHGK